MEAMMASIASELRNTCTYNFVAKYIEDKFLAINPSLGLNVRSLRMAQVYIMGHAGGIEKKHGLHAIAAAQAYGCTVNLNSDALYGF